MAVIKTTGDLREFLAHAINGVANGTLAIDKAKEIGKLSAQINESFYSEVKVAKTQVELGREADRLGELNMTWKDDEA